MSKENTEIIEILDEMNSLKLLSPKDIIKLRNYYKDILEIEKETNSFFYTINWWTLPYCLCPDQNNRNLNELEEVIHKYCPIHSNQPFYKLLNKKQKLTKTISNQEKIYSVLLNSYKYREKVDLEVDNDQKPNKIVVNHNRLTVKYILEWGLQRYDVFTDRDDSFILMSICSINDMIKFINLLESQAFIQPK